MAQSASSARAQSEPNDMLVDTLAPVRGPFAHLAGSIADVIPRVLAAVLVMVAFWSVAALLRRATRVLCLAVLRDRTAENLITEVTY